MHELSLAVEIGGIAERKLGATVSRCVAVGVDVGEQARTVLFPVTEGDDKPLKYPKLFERADWVVMTKTDLLPYVPFDVERAERNCRKVSQALRCLRVSALSGDGLAAWFDLLRQPVAPLARV